MDYDAAGNQKNDGYTSFGSTNGAVTRTYDAENRMLTALDVPNNTTDSYTYDGEGRRVKRITPNQGSNQETWQIYGIGGELLAEYAANANPATTSPLKEYGYRNGELLITAEPSGSDLRFFLTIVGVPD
jgi:YD repeat-containing protein